MISIAGWMQRHGDLPRIDREILLMDTLGKNRAYLFAHSEEPLDDASQSLLDHAITRLQAGEPLAYVRGWKEFRALRFEVSPGVLVPRPETELLVDLVLQQAGKEASVLDLGTGSGAIAVSIAHENPSLIVTATDVSVDALAVAKRNALVHAPRVTFAQGDWFAAVSGTYDIVVSNPPYIGEGEPALAALQAEPRIALVSGSDGLHAIRSIISAAPQKCRHALLIEHGASQGAAVRSLFVSAGFHSVRTESDLAGHERVTWGLRHEG